MHSTGANVSERNAGAEPSPSLSTRITVSASAGQSSAKSLVNCRLFPIPGGERVRVGTRRSGRGRTPLYSFSSPWNAGGRDICR